MRMMLLPLPFPRTPDRGLLLRDPDQNHPAFTTFSGCRFQRGTGHFLLALTLLEVHDGDLPFFGELVDGLDVALADLAKRGGGRNPEPALPAEEAADLAHRLKL
jgi:hypothetical protein